MITNAFFERTSTHDDRLAAEREFVNHGQEFAKRFCTEPDDSGPLVIAAIATAITSQHYFNARFTFESFARYINGAGGLTTADKSDGCAHTAGPLEGGFSETGARRIQANVRGYHVLTLDFDKGHASPEQVIARCAELGLFAAAMPSFSDGATSHKIAWHTTLHSRKTGRVEQRAGSFQSFCVGAPPSNELARRFCIEVEGYCPAALGDVRLGEQVTEESDTTKTTYYLIHHNPIPKTRLFVAITPFMKGEFENVGSFKERWTEFYHAVAGMIGIPYDHSCDTIERGFYGITRNSKLAEPPPVPITRGKVLEHEDPRILTEIAKGPPQKPARPVQVRAESLPSESDLPPLPENASPLVLAHAVKKRGECLAARKALQNKWRGFRAADAAADLWDDVTDKRKDSNLVALECPFIDEHFTSNKPGTRQLAIFNADSRSALPTCKCQSDTCQGRPYEDFLEALFPDETRFQTQYRSA